MTLSAQEETFERWRKILGAVAAPIAFVVTFTLTADFDPKPRTLSGILTAVAVLWMTEAVPLPVTALLAAIFCVVLGVAPAKQVFAYYADPIVFLFIGSFMLARAMTIHRLDRRIALGFLSIPWIGGNPTRVLAGMGAVTAFISMWVSNSATTSMMLPVALGVLGTLHQVRVAGGATNAQLHWRHWSFATGMMLMIAYGSAVGGIGTPVGSPPNLICIGFIRTAVGRQISFVEWMMLTVPLLILMMTVLLVLLSWLHRSRDSNEDTTEVSGSLRKYVSMERTALGPWTAGQRNTLIAFGIAATLWIVPGILKSIPSLNSWSNWFEAHVPESVAALIAAVCLFVLPVDLKNGQFTIDWKDAVQIDWGTILLFGGGLALGTLMFETGVAAKMGKALAELLGVNSVWTITGLAIAIGIVLSEATSNTAASNMVIPVVIGISQTAGISPIPPAIGACLGASFGFMLPVSTPPNAIVYGSGLVSIPSMMCAGILFDVIGFFLIWGGVRVMCPLMGLM